LLADYTHVYGKDKQKSDISYLLSEQFWGSFSPAPLKRLILDSKESLGAFFSHIPTDGNIILLIAIHASINNVGEIKFKDSQITDFADFVKPHLDSKKAYADQVKQIYEISKEMVLE
jgi:hypothetical protein